MAAGYNLSVGLDIQQVEARLKTLTSKVTSTFEQLYGLTEIAPHVKTKDFEVGLKRMTDAYNEFSSKVNKGITIRYGSGKNAGTLNYDSLFGSRNQMEKSQEVLKKILAGNTSSSHNKDELREIVQLQELYLKGVNAAAAAVDKQKAAILKAVEAEAKLVEKRRQKESSLRNQIDSNPLKSVKDIEKAIRLSQQLSNEMRKWGTRAGEIGATKNDARTEELQKKLEIAKKNVAEEKRVLSLAEKQEQLLKKQNEADQNSISGLTERYNLSKKILDIQRQLVGTAFYDKNIIEAQKAMADPKLVAFNRKYATHSNAFENATDFTTELKELNAMRQLLLNRQVQTGRTYKETAEIEKLIAKTKELARAEKEREQSNKQFAGVIEKITNLEKKRAAAKGLSSKIAQFQQERIAVTGLITQWEKYLSIARKANNSAEIARANAKLDVLRKEAVELRNLEQAERSRRTAINQNKSLFNDQIGIIEKLKTYASNYLSLYSLFRVGKEMIDATKYFEQQRVALEGIVGSAIEATKALNGLKQMALESPFELKSLVGYTKQLSAYGIEVEALLPTVDSLADLSAGLGVDMSRLILAYGQVNAASVLRGQELRQFTEAGIPLVEKLSEKFTQLNGKLVTTGEVFEMISKRQVSFEMVAEVLRDMTAEGGAFYKMQENLTDTLYGQIEKLKDTWTIKLNEVGSKLNNIVRGIVETLQKVIHNIPLLLSAISFAGILKTATALPILFKKVGNSIHAINVQMRWFERGLSRTVGAGNKLAFVFKNMLASLKSNLVVAAISLIGGAIINAVAKTREWKKELEEIDRSFAKDTAKYTVGFEKLISRLAMATEGTKEYNDAIETLKSNYGDYVNDALINQLIEERRQLQDTAQGWGMLHDSIVAAIVAKKEYERHETRKNTAAEGLLGEFNANKVLNELARFSRNERAKYGSLTDPEMHKYYEDIERQLKNENIKTALQDAIADFTEAGETSIDDFESRLVKKLKTQGVNVEASDFIVEKIGSIFERVTKSDKWKTYLHELGILENDPYELIKKEFSNAKNIVFNSQEGRWVDGMENTDYNPFKLSLIEDQQAAIAAEDLIDNFFGNLSDEDINNQSGFKKAKDAIINAFGDLSLEAFQADAGKTKTIADALNGLFATIKNPELRAQLSAITNAFLEMAGTKTGRAKSISSAIMADYGVGSNADQATKDFMARYLPNDENIDELRDAIAKEISSLRSKIKSYGPTQENEGNREYVEWMKAELKKYETLASDKYYDITEEEVKAAGKKDLYKRLRITNFFDELLSVITKAEDAMKNAVGVTGYTDQLGEFVKGLKPDNFLRAFFEEGGNPFEKIFAKMTEYGVTEFLPEFNKNTLENIFRSVGWEEGKEISVPDFQAMYEKIIKQIAEQVLTNLRTRRDQYAEGTSEYNSLDSAIKSMQDFQLKSIETMETRWGGDEIEKKIEAAIKELTNINSNLDKIRSRRDMYDRISKAGNYVDARGALGGRTLSMSNAVSGGILSMLRGSGAGVASTNAGGRLMNMLIGGELNINNLSALLSIAKELEEQAASLDPNTSGQFVKSTNYIVDAINKLVDDIMVEYEQLMQLRTEDMVASDTITNLGESYKIALQNISDGIVNGTITLEEAIEMRRKAVQDNYNSLLNAVGGTELPKWIARLYADGKSPFGVSNKGMKMASTFGSSSINDMVIRALSQKYQAGEYGKVGSEDAIDKFTKEVLDTIAVLERMNSIVKKVSSAISNTVDALESSMGAIRSLGSRLKASNGMQGGIDESYYATQAGFSATSQVLSTIGNFAGGVSGAWGSFMSGDIFGAITGVISTISDLISNIIDINDSLIQNKQDAIIRSNEKLVKAMEDLENALSTSAGNERYDIYKTQRENLMQQKLQYEQLYALELQKKEGDPEKAKEYADQVKSIDNELSQMIKDFKAEILGTADDLANTLTNALVGAFREGTNAARAWRDAVKSYIGDILKQELMTKVISPFIDDVMDDFFGTEQLGKDEVLDLFSNKDKVNSFVSALNDAGVDLIDIFNQLPEDLKNYISFNGSTSALAGGISGITEDTARTLEGIGNSQLMQLVLINRTLTQYLESTSGYENNQYMASVQTHLQQINNNVGLILRSITELRDTPSRPLHVTIA